jgi:hypothetical protein
MQSQTEFGRITKAVLSRDASDGSVRNIYDNHIISAHFILSLDLGHLLTSSALFLYRVERPSHVHNRVSKTINFHNHNIT